MTGKGRCDYSPAMTRSAKLGKVAIERAAAELRAGRAAVLRAGAERALVAAAEVASDPLIEEMRAAAGERSLLVALTLKRAAVLKIQPSYGDEVVVPLAANSDAALVRSLADPVFDLARPMRGPFRRIKAPQGEAVRAAIPLCRHARLLPAALIAPFTGRVPAGPVAVDAEIVLSTPFEAPLLVRVTDARVPLAGAEGARIVAFRPEDGGLEHLAIVVGDPPRDRPVLARLHSSCLTGDFLGSLKCDCGDQLRGAIAAIGQAGGGVLLYLAQEGRGIGIVNKLRAYALQDQGFDTVDANERLGFEADERAFGPAAAMLKALGFAAVRLMTNNPEKVAGLEAEGIKVAERVPHAFPPNAHNERYLATKAKKSGHYL